LVEREPESLAAWEGLLAGLDEAPRPEELAATFDEVPAELAGAPELRRFAAKAAQQRGEWSKAIGAFQEAVAFDPADFETRARWASALRLAKLIDEADRMDQEVERARAARNGLLALHDQANALETIGEAPHIEICEHIASAYEAMVRPEEAAAWRRVGPGMPRANE
jgi:tetratricopeptide (TPR) repeat protein